MISRSIIHLLIAVLLIPTLALADTDVVVGGAKMENESGVPGVLGDVNDSIEKLEAGEGGEEQNRETVIAPLPSRNSALGWMVSLPAMLMYKPSFADPEDRVWISGLFGFYAENDSWGAGAMQRMSLGGDRWRVVGSLFHADINYRYFGIGGPEEGRSIILEQDFDVIFFQGLRRIAPNFYAGLRGVYTETSIGPRLPVGEPSSPDDLGILRADLTLSTLAPRLQYDSRDEEFYPQSGAVANFTATFSREAFGADTEYEQYEFDVNKYHALSNNAVIATRIALKYVDEDTPFFLYPAFGQESDLRGYQMGSYRDQFLVAAQAEYRHRFNERWGAVAFAGIGSVSPDFLGWEESLWSVGAGLRWVVAPENNISLRFDIARGRDETIYYVGVGESF